MKQVNFIALRDVAMAATAENHVRLAQDFYVWLQIVVAVKAVNPESICTEMKWTDDGDHKCTGVRFIPVDTPKPVRKPRKKK